jgi:hypothetical protein
MKGKIMLKVAYYYNTKIQEEYQNIVYNEKFKFFCCSSYWSFKFEDCSSSNWFQIEYVSVDKNDNVIGFLGAEVERDINKVKSLRIINFKDKCNVTFSKDLHKFLIELFTVHNFNKINFSVVCGNPIEKMYDKYCAKYGGRIVGICKKDVKLTDGKLYDYKIYEIFKDDFINSQKEKNNE